MADLSTERVSFEAALAALLDQYELGPGTGTILETRLTLINMVKAKLDEVIPEGEGVQFQVEGDVNISDPLNLLINAILDESAKRVLLICPINYVDPVKSEETAGIINSNAPKTGYIVLPDNFLRFVSLKMADWTRPVIKLTPIESEEYIMQQNAFTRGGTTKPRAAINHYTVTGTQKRVLEYYSVDSLHTIDYLYYVQETVAEDVQQNLWDALTWNAAGMILQITERTDLAKAAFEQEQLCYLNLS